MIEDEEDIYSTWLSIPVVSFHIGTIEVDFRIFGQHCGRSGFAHGNGGPSFQIWSLFALLNRFLQRGPNFRSSTKTRQKIEVNLIVLNVVSPPEPEEGFLSDNWLTRDSKKMGVIHPVTVLHHIESELDHLLQKTKYTIEYASTVYAGVRRIKLMLDGKIKKDWDLVAMKIARQQATTASP